MGDLLRPVLVSILAYPRAPDFVEGPGDLSTWEPGDPTYFGTAIDLYIGGTDDPDGATDSFATILCSPSWLKDHITDIQTDDPQESVWQTGLPYRTGRGLWLMPRWDHDAFSRDLDTLLTQAAGLTWPVVANRLSRHLDWEYDYRFDDAIGRSPVDLR
jgi:immunity protein 8 of polymorphic toxin system